MTSGLLVGRGGDLVFVLVAGGFDRRSSGGGGRGRATCQAYHERIIIVGHDAIYAREDGVDEVVVPGLESIRGHIDDVVLQVTCGRGRKWAEEEVAKGRMEGEGKNVHISSVELNTMKVQFEGRRSGRTLWFRFGELLCVCVPVCVWRCMCVFVCVGGIRRVAE